MFIQFQTYIICLMIWRNIRFPSCNPLLDRPFHLWSGVQKSAT